MEKRDLHIIDKPHDAMPEQHDDDFVVHVMPREFQKKKAVAAPVAKPQVQPKPVEIVEEPEAPKPPLPKKPVKPKKNQHRFIIWGGLLFIIAMVIIAVTAALLLRNTQDQPVEEQEPVIIDDDQDSEEPVIEEDPTVVLQPALDTDSDGLTDSEEDLYRTDFRNPDTDADSFLDGNEVFHRYDPLGYAPSTLLDTGSVTVFTSVSTDQPFSFYYPSAWKIIQASDQEQNVTTEVSIVTTTTATLKFTRYIGEANRFAAWAVEEGVNRSRLQASLTKVGYELYEAEDGLTAYILANDDIFVVTYDTGSDTSIHFLQTFKMMLNSLTF